MQQSRIERFNSSLVVRSQAGMKMREHMAYQHSKVGQLLNTYVTSLFFVEGIVRIVQVIRYVLSFIFSHFLTGKKHKQQKVGQTYVTAARQIEQQGQPPDLDEHELNEIEEGRLKDNFLSMASHELKTPMTTILGQAQLMKRRLSKIPELSGDLTFMRSALESIDSQTRRMNSLVNDLLDMYNIRSGKIELHMDSCDLITLCHDVVKEQRLLTGRTIQLDVPVSPVIMQADGSRLSQVIVNLISNALRYSPEDSGVQVFVDKHHDVGIIEVCDAGAGIPQGEQAHIFEPFYRSPKNVCTSSKSGLGLGLAISKDIIERHGGRIWCRSRVGQGSTFIVEIPMKGYVSHGCPLSRQV
ncbi:MAG TPA: HAMP domain-containing sensor histidine kinase [Ktedonobacteraceae bacterium]|nr:HAMP domain-containing sensor histidine kinase [Ktedonobacteraceae bacterium]